MAIDERRTETTAQAALAVEPGSVADDIERELAQEVLTPALGARLAGRLAELEVELTRRYESEACSALYQDVPGGKPRYERRLSALRREHRGIVSRARRLAAAAHDVEDATSLSHLRSEALELLAHLRRHEDAEERLLAEAFFVDIGVAE